MRQIFNLTVDLKYREGHAPAIIEIMPGHFAGYTGYTAAGQGSMVDDKIIPYLIKAFPGEPVVRPYSFGMANLGEDFGQAAARAGHGIIYPYSTYRHGPCPLFRSDFCFAQEHPEFQIVNADVTFINLFWNKASIALLNQGNRVLESAFAPTLVLSSDHEGDMGDHIREQLGDHSNYVIKPADQSRGTGVRVVSNAGLDRLIDKIMRFKEKPKLGLRGFDYWRSDINPVLVVQPYISSTPVIKSGLHYDGTMRVTATLHRESDANPWDICVHDGYWKLPDSLYGGFNAPVKAISYSPKSSERSRFQILPFFTNPVSFLFGHKKFLHDLNAAPINNTAREEVFPWLETVLPQSLDAVLSKPLAQRIETWINSDDACERGAGVMAACNSLYYPSTMGDKIHRDSHCYPEPIKQRLTEIFKQDRDSAVAQYLASLAEPKLEQSFPPGLKETMDNIQKSKPPEGWRAMVNTYTAYLVAGGLEP